MCLYPWLRLAPHSLNVSSTGTGIGRFKSFHLQYGASYSLQDNYERNKESNCGLLHKLIHAVRTEVGADGEPLYDPEIITGFCLDLIAAGKFTKMLPFFTNWLIAVFSSEC